MLDFVVERLAAAGIKDGVLVTNRTFVDAFRDWAAQRTAPVQLEIMDDGATSNEDRLGSIGDLQFALTQGDIRDDFLVVNGDNLFTFALGEVLDTFRRRGNTIVLYDVGSKAEAAKMGVPTCDSAGRVVGFREKPQDPGTTLVSIGIYAYRAEVRGVGGSVLGGGELAGQDGLLRRVAAPTSAGLRAHDPGRRGPVVRYRVPRAVCRGQPRDGSTPIPS